MKKKFIFLAMMLLTLVGGVKTNDLRAQDDVVTINGDATSQSGYYPIAFGANYQISQHIYNADDINHDAGNINKIAFKINVTDTRNLTFYLVNTDKETLSTWEDYSDTNMFFQSNSIDIVPTDGWFTFELNADFEYTGGNILLVAEDNTGSYNSSNYGSGCHFKSVSGYVTHYLNGSNPVSTSSSGYQSARQPAIKFFFAESGPQPLSLTVTADEENIWNDETATLTAKAKGGAAPYTYSWTLNGEAIEGATAETYTFSNETAGAYSFTCTVTDSESTTATASVTVNVAERPVNPFAGKQYRIKVVEGYYEGQYLKVLSHEITNPYFYNDPEDAATRVGVSTFEQNPLQIFTITDDGEGHYYLCDADGYYIKCDDQSSWKGRNTWDIDAYSTTIKTPLMFDYVNETNFYIRDYDKYVGNGSTANYSTTNNYFKVENDKVYCDAPIDYNESDKYSETSYLTTWTVEEVLPVAPNAPVLTAEALSATSIRLSWDAVYGAESYTVYEGENVIAENITDTYYEVSGLTASTTYTYSVTATNEVGTSEKSNEASATTWVPAPEAAPANLAYSNLTHNSVTLSWDAVDGATYYEVYKDAIYYDYTYTTTLDVTGLSAETEYTFTVKAGNNSGMSPESDGLVVTTSEFEGRIVVFELTDSYGDGWNGGKLTIYQNGSDTGEMTISTGYSQSYEYDIPYGTNVVVYYTQGSYAYENKFSAYYKDDNSIVIEEYTGSSGNTSFTFTVERPAPKNLAANPSMIYPGGSTTLTWEAFEGAASYNVYVNSDFNANTTETTFVLADINDDSTIEVEALNENGEVISGKASVTVQVAGTFTLTVNVKDVNGNPIEGATVAIDMAYAYDELNNKIEDVDPATTGVDGVATLELSVLTNQTYFYANNGNYVYTPFYTINVSKSPYDNLDNYINYYDDVTNGYTMNIVLELPYVDYVQVQDEKGNALHGDIMEGSNIVLSWDAVESADAYKVYTLTSENEVLSSEKVYDNKYAVEGVEKGSNYAVTALFGELESEKAYTDLQVKGVGYFSGVVTDGTNPLAGIQVKLFSDDSDESVVVTTDESGAFTGEIMEGEYKLMVSHSNYDVYESENNIIIAYQQLTDIGTITLTAKPLAEGITVTATAEGDYANVSWTGDYAKYNVYRREAGAQDSGEQIATEVTTTSYTDNNWSTLEPGSYEYGVAALECDSKSFTQGFNDGHLPDDWTQSNTKNYTIEGEYTWNGTTLQYAEGRGSAYFYYYGNTSGCEHRLISPAIDLGTSENATLKFKYYIWSQWGSSYSNKLTVRVATSPDGPWDDVAWNESYYTGQTWQDVECPLPHTGTVYVAFCTTLNYCYTYLDAVEITADSSYETAIVWSNEIEKQGPNTFEGTVSTDWNVVENWSNGNVPEAGDEVIVNAEAVISGNVELSALDIVGNGSVTVDANASLIVTGAITQEQDYSLIMNDGAQVFQNNANVTAQFNMNLVNPSDWSNSNKDGWQFISSPLSNVSVTNIAEGNYDLYKYKGDAESGLEWLNHKDVNFADATYQHHIGYLASHETKATLEFKGTLNTKDAYGFYEYIDYYENEEELLKNFHLIGNPYPYNITWADFKNSVGIYNGYAYVKSDGNYEYATSGTIAPGDGFFVKATGVGEYGTYYYYLEGSGNTRSTRESNNSLNIVATSNAGKDNVVINLGGEKAGFNKLQNFNDAIATVYVQDNGANYGIYNCNEDVQEIELCFNANQMGNYTISIQPNGKFQTVTLVDRFTGVETNMLVEDYHFTAMSGTNNNRFIVKLAVSDQQSANSNFVYQSGEELVIDAEGTVQIIDVMGRVVYSDDVESTNNRINVSGFQNGTYMVRVINGSEVKVEKVVIY